MPLSEISKNGITQPTDDPRTGKRHNAASVAKELGVSRTTLYHWRTKATDLLQVCKAGVNKQKTVRSCSFELIERALRTHTAQTIEKMNGISMFHEDVIKRTALYIRDKMVTKLETAVCDELPEQEELKLTCANLNALKGSTGGFYGFLKGSNLKS